VALCLRHEQAAVQVLERAEHHLSAEQRCITRGHTEVPISRKVHQSPAHGSTCDPRAVHTVAAGHLRRRLAINEQGSQDQARLRHARASRPTPGLSPMS
jgi:hypothetical protein